VKPPLRLELEWIEELRFSGRADTVALVLDSDGRAGPSPMQVLGFGLAACMAMDVVHVLEKSRVPARALTARLTGQRAEEPPRRFTGIDLHFEIATDASEEQVERAVALSRDKYCSVWNSMRQDIALSVTWTLRP
jgi:putative redox protein